MDVFIVRKYDGTRDEFTIVKVFLRRENAQSWIDANDSYEGQHYFEEWETEDSFRKLERDEVIREGDMHSYQGAGIQPLMSDISVGQTPNDFSTQRDFYRPV